MQGQPIPFIELKEQQTQNGMETVFEVNPQSIKLLHSLKDKKVAILTIAGPQRTGKSFLANRILKRQKGFAIGPTTMPCTKGIWLWSQPIPLNESTSILLMDTEGLNSVQRDLSVDIKIFSISLLLSSMFIYNQLGHIDEQSIENLSLVIKLSESISVGDDKSLSQFFPNFLWVLRDFSLDLKGRTSADYLEYALQDHQGVDADKKNLIRRKIREYFKSRDCICMVRPLTDEHRLARIEDEDWNALRPEFIQSVYDFEKHVAKTIQPKMINNTILTADMFLKLSLEYVDAINSGGIPQILTSLDRVIQQEARNIAETLKTDYAKKLGEVLAKLKAPYDDDELISAHRSVIQNVLDKLTRKSQEILDAQRLAQIRSELVSMMDADLQNRIELNKEQTNAVSNQLLGKFFNSYQVPVLENVDSIKPTLISDRFQEYSRFYKYYGENAKGNTKYKHISEKMPSFLFGYFDKLITQIQRVYVEENNQTRKYLVQAREGEERLRKTITNYENLLYEVQKEKEGLAYEGENNKRELQKIEKIRELEQESLQQKIKQIGLELATKKDKNSKLKAENQSLLEQVQRTKNELNAKRVECAQLLKRVSEDSTGRGTEVGEDFTNELVLQYKDIKQQAAMMNEFFRKRAIDSSQYNIFIPEIQKLQQEKFNEVQKIRDDYKLKKQKLRDELEAEKKQLKNSMEHILRQNEELKAQNITLYEKMDAAQKSIQQMKTLQQDNSRLNQSLEEKIQTLDMHIQVIDNFTKDIEKLTGIREDLEQKLAFMNSEKSNLISFKESFPYILKESLKWVLNKNSKIKHAMKSVGDEEQKTIKDCFHEVGINI